MPINLNTQTQKVVINSAFEPVIIVQPDQQTTILTGYTQYLYQGSGWTVVTVTGFNPKLVTVYTPIGVSKAEFDSYTGATELRLQDIEADIAFLSGVCDTKLDIITFSAYTGSTAILLQQLQQDIQYISGVTSGNTASIIYITQAFNQHSGNTLIHQTSGDTVNIVNNILNSNYWTSGQTLLAISAVTSATTYNLQTPAAVTVGGITAGTQLTGKTSFELFEEMLVPILYPVFTNPSNGFTTTANSLYEIAEVQTLAFNSTFSRGSITPPYGTSGNRSGLPSAYNYTGVGLPGIQLSSSLSDSQNSVNYTIVIGNQSWTSSVTYLIGEQPKDSKGGNYNSPFPGGTTSIITRTIEGVYPIFATTLIIATLLKQALQSMLTANNIVYSLVPETGGDKQAFELPDVWLVSRPLTAIQTYNTISAQWEYQGGSASTSLTYWTTSAVTETIQGNIINYTKYTYNGIDRSAVQIKLIF